MLSDLVARGALPPVSQRLPEHPLVIRPIATIGRYGGTIQRALTGDVIQKTGITKTLSENLLGYHRPLPDSIELNLAEGFEFADDGKTIVFRIRKGVRWSDGVPFTVDDILFWYQDLALDAEASGSAAPPGRSRRKFENKGNCHSLFS